MLLDWLTTASLRDSENWFLDYDSVNKETAGMTLPGELADWFRRAGYTEVREDANLKFTKKAGDIELVGIASSGGYVSTSLL